MPAHSARSECFGKDAPLIGDIIQGDDAGELGGCDPMHFSKDMVATLLTPNECYPARVESLCRHFQAPCMTIFRAAATNSRSSSVIWA